MRSKQTKQKTYKTEVNITYKTYKKMNKVVTWRNIFKINIIEWDSKLVETELEQLHTDESISDIYNYN